MESCNYTDVWIADESLLRLHQVLDVIIVMAYFAIPLVLIYSIRLSPLFPRKKEFIYFGIVSIFCGVNYMTNVFKYDLYLTSEVTMSMKGCYATMLWLAVVVLNSIFPDLVTLKKREIFLKNNVEKLSSSHTLVLRKVNTRKSLSNLIREIRGTTDWHSIIKSAVIGLGKILNLKECALWVPSVTNNTLVLSHCLKGAVPIGSTVPMSLPVIAEILRSINPVRVSHTCPLVKATSICEQCISHMAPNAVAIRVPLRNYWWIEHTDGPSNLMTSFAVMVLVPSSDGIVKFRDDELELVRDVIEQVTVALAQASAFEDSTMACNNLRIHNSSLASAVRDMEMVFRESVVWHDGILNQMLMLQDFIPFLSSFLLETTLTPEQRTVVETVLKSSSSLETLVENVRDLSRLDDGSLELIRRGFDLSATINQVIDRIKPIAVVKKLSLILSLAPDLPTYAVGDQDRLMQIFLNILENAVKFTKEGIISVTISLVESKSFRDWWPRQFYMVPSRKHFYLKVEVKDSGCGINPIDLGHIFNLVIKRQCTPNQFSSSGLGLPICKRLLNLMRGDIWVESEGFGKGTTVTFIIKLRRSRNGPKSNQVADEHPDQAAEVADERPDQAAEIADERPDQAAEIADERPDQVADEPGSRSEPSAKA